jgi:hypothetical protein
MHAARCILTHSARLDSLLQDQQQEYYIATWEEDQTALYESYYDMYLNEHNLSVPRAAALAWNQSIHAATGGTACVINTYAGGTFVHCLFVHSFIRGQNHPNTVGVAVVGTFIEFTHAPSHHCMMDCNLVAFIFLAQPGSGSR